MSLALCGDQHFLQMENYFKILRDMALKHGVSIISLPREARIIAWEEAKTATATTIAVKKCVNGMTKRSDLK